MPLHVIINAKVPICGILSFRFFVKEMLIRNTKKVQLLNLAAFEDQNTGIFKHCYNLKVKNLVSTWMILLLYFRLYIFAYFYILGLFHANSIFQATLNVNALFYAIYNNMYIYIFNANAVINVNAIFNANVQFYTRFKANHIFQAILNANVQ